MTQDFMPYKQELQLSLQNVSLVTDCVIIKFNKIQSALQKFLSAPISIFL